jgi:hypothetical protein
MYLVVLTKLFVKDLNWYDSGLIDLVKIEMMLSG